MRAKREATNHLVTVKSSWIIFLSITQSLFTLYLSLSSIDLRTWCYLWCIVSSPQILGTRVVCYSPMKMVWLINTFILVILIWIYSLPILNVSIACLGNLVLHECVLDPFWYECMSLVTLCIMDNWQWMWCVCLVRISRSWCH